MVMLTLYFWMIFSFPGYCDKEHSIESYQNYVNWADTTRLKLFQASDAVWLTLNITSTTVTGFAIRKIFKITNALSLTNSNFMIDKKLLVIHVVVLILQLIASFGFISYDIFPLSELVY